MQALEEQFQCEEGYQITYNDFMFKGDKADPHIKIVPFEHSPQLDIALEPTLAKV